MFLTRRGMYSNSSQTYNCSKKSEKLALAIANRFKWKKLHYFKSTLQKESRRLINSRNELYHIWSPLHEGDLSIVHSRVGHRVLPECGPAVWGKKTKKKRKDNHNNCLTESIQNSFSCIIANHMASSLYKWDLPLNLYTLFYIVSGWRTFFSHPNSPSAFQVIGRKNFTSTCIEKLAYGNWSITILLKAKKNPLIFFLQAPSNS